jgi:hypothetical protein
MSPSTCIHGLNQDNDKHVSAEYVAGITEGRQLLKLMQAAGDDIQAEIPSILANLKAACRGASAPVREMYRGEADFWRGQIR